ncbi:MAG: hypothetical protein IJ689_05185 [Alphaproteobacteria bacterium]|nr:hypothetical protein [Alphaproteobacteria bacterium]
MAEIPGTNNVGPELSSAKGAGRIPRLNEELRRRQRERLERLRAIQIGKQGSQTEIANPRVIVAQAVKREYPHLPYDEVQKATRELVLAPKRASVKIGNQEVAVEDLQFQIAESIELINSETNSAQEYFSWFEDCSSILQHMNDGYVTDADLAERNDWLSDSYTREAEIMTCLGLYQSSAFPEAKQKYDQLYNKLVKLRQIRNAIKEATGSSSDEEKDRIDAALKALDYRKALMYVAAIREFQKHGERWNMPRNTLRRLNMYRGDDDDISGEYEWFYGGYEPDFVPEDGYEFEREEHRFDDDLKEYVLFHWDDDQNDAPVHAHAEDMVEHRMAPEDNTEEDIKTRIARLSGRRPPLKNTAFGAKEDRAQSFDADRFRRLSGAKKQNLL